MNSCISLAAPQQTSGSRVQREEEGLPRMVNRYMSHIHSTQHHGASPPYPPKTTYVNLCQTEVIPGDFARHRE
jgi:hypothetical protein